MNPPDSHIAIRQDNRIPSSLPNHPGNRPEDGSDRDSQNVDLNHPYNI